MQPRQRLQRSDVAAIALRDLLPDDDREVGPLERALVRFCDGLPQRRDHVRLGHAIEQVFVAGDELLLEVRQRRQPLEGRPRLLVAGPLGDELHAQREGRGVVVQLLVERGELAAQLTLAQQPLRLEHALEHRDALALLARRLEHAVEELGRARGDVCVRDERDELGDRARLAGRQREHLSEHGDRLRLLVRRQQRARLLQHAAELEVRIGGQRGEAAQRLGALLVAAQGAEHALERDERVDALGEREEREQRLRCAVELGGLLLCAGEREQGGGALGHRGRVGALLPEGREVGVALVLLVEVHHALLRVGVVGGVGDDLGPGGAGALGLALEVEPAGERAEQ